MLSRGVARRGALSFPFRETYDLQGGVRRGVGELLLERLQPSAQHVRLRRRQLARQSLEPSRLGGREVDLHRFGDALGSRHVS